MWQTERRTHSGNALVFITVVSYFTRNNQQPLIKIQPGPARAHTVFHRWLKRLYSKTAALAMITQRRQTYARCAFRFNLGFYASSTDRTINAHDTVRSKILTAKMWKLALTRNPPYPTHDAADPDPNRPTATILLVPHWYRRTVVYHRRGAVMRYFYIWDCSLTNNLADSQFDYGSVRWQDVLLTRDFSDDSNPFGDNIATIIDSKTKCRHSQLTMRLRMSFTLWRMSRKLTSILVMHKIININVTRYRPICAIDRSRYAI